MSKMFSFPVLNYIFPYDIMKSQGTFTSESPEHARSNEMEPA
jgi:hypothetical protein